MPTRRGAIAPRRRTRAARKRYVQRALYRKAYPRGMASRTHMFKRNAAPILIGTDQNGFPTLIQDGNGAVTLGNLTPGILSNSNMFGLSYTAMLKSLIEYQDFTGLFDRYKVMGVKLKIMYHNNLGDANQHALPMICYAFDGDDASIPTSYEDVARRGYSKEKVLNANLPLSVFFKPRITKSVYQTGLTNGYTSEKATWIDCSNETVEHYGWKAWISTWLGTPTAPSGQLLSIQPTFYFACKDSL